ncbi:OmpH family outer membrane protein [uncultured Polaribacter sp.]|uniref:OmpH family outer membrane protein n=1 Tax=uncultured Polaribacter sp. TaxID=174711 RepID=UPI00261193E5|nr:OmpH family outer membrane protein [uncultured Polaribacter sp.]
MKQKIFILIALAINTITLAQTKVGTVDNDYILNLMPEGKTVIKLTQKYGAKLDSSFNIKLNELKLKIEDYKLKEKEMGDLEKKVTQKELTELDKEVQQYKKNGNTLMGLKQEELMRPLYKKLGKAIEEISKENGYSQILTVKGNQFAYLDPKFDITKLVLKRLGIKEPEVK